LGPAALEADRWSRVLGFWRATAGDLAQLDADEQAALDAYASGVNAYVAANRYRMPAEFTLLGYKPAAWTARDSLGLLKVMGWALSQNWDGELLRVQLAARVGPERAAEIDPTYPADHPVATGEAGQVPAEDLAEVASQVLASYQQAGHWLGQTISGGSNAWVVGPSNTATRRPLLANDPHMTVPMPAILYQNHLDTADGSLRVAGASLAGVPGVISGHNERIAWGITAGRSDIQDLYVEQRHAEQPTWFRCGEAWEPAVELEELIPVRGWPQPHVEPVLVTRHGPVVNGLVELAPDERVLPSLALRWTGHAPSTSFRGLWRMQVAQDWDSFRDALSHVTEPSLNTVYADVDGNIGYQHVGRVPVRRRGSGLMPAPGWDDSHEWEGLIPFAELPHVLNPPQGQLVTANNKPMADDGLFLGADWAPGYRAKRIERMLQAKPRFTLRDFQAMQMDVYSVQAEDLVPYFIMVDGDQPLQRRILQELEAWNLRVDVDSFAAAAYEVMRLHLLDLVFGDKLGPQAGQYKGRSYSDIFASSTFSGKAGQALISLLEEEQSWWFHDAATGRTRTRDEVLQLALQRTAETLYQLIGKDPRKWAWGKVHQVEFAHLMGQGRLLRAIFNRGQFPVSGDEHTVWMTGYDLSLPFGLVTASASYRQVLDVGDWDRSTAILPTGQSGQPLNAHYADFIDMWREGEQHGMPWTRPAVDQAAVTTLRLEPAGQVDGR
jgi:penicillin amidase